MARRQGGRRCPRAGWYRITYTCCVTHVVVVTCYTFSGIPEHNAHLGGWEGRVEEEPDANAVEPLAQEQREDHQMVVVDPHVV